SPARSASFMPPLMIVRGSRSTVIALLLCTTPLHSPTYPFRYPAFVFVTLGSKERDGRRAHHAARAHRRARYRAVAARGRGGRQGGGQHHGPHHRLRGLARGSRRAGTPGGANPVARRGTRGGSADRHGR